jgi:hypothetical protein
LSSKFAFVVALFSFQSTRKCGLLGSQFHMEKLWSIGIKIVQVQNHLGNNLCLHS